MRLFCGIILAKIGASLFWGVKLLADLEDLADGNLFFFIADTDLAAILDLAFYLKEPLILG